MPRPLEQRRALAWLVYALVVFASLALGWNRFATRFGRDDTSIRRNGDVFERAAADLQRTLAALPAPVLPRIAIFGSSQIAVVKSSDADPVLGIPHQLEIALAGRGLQAEIVDFSDGGQQLIESLLVFLATRHAARPSMIVVGVSLFSMARLDVRPTLLAGLDVAAVRDVVRENLPADADPQAVEALLSFGRGGEQQVAGRGPTIQEQADDVIGSWLSADVAAFANRQRMFDVLIDRPIRQDLVRFVMQRVQQEKTARTYEIGSAYPVSLLALEAMQRAAAGDGVPLLVVSLPYDDTRPPVPFTADTQARVLADLRARGFTLLDLSHELGSERFGAFLDGSPDDLHFDPLGHATVAARIADVAQRELETVHSQALH